MKRTKAFHTFLMKLDRFNEDLELINYLSIRCDQRILSDITQDFINLHKLSLDNPKEIKRLFGHLANTIYSSFVKDVYEEVTYYIREILFLYFKEGIVNHERLIGEYNFEVNAKTILSQNDWDGICRYISDQIYTKIEKERSTLRLLDEIPKRLDINIDKTITETTVNHLNLRHYLVHEDGKIKTELANNFPGIIVNSKIRLSSQFIQSFRTVVVEYLTKFDEQIVSRNVIPQKFLMPQNF